MVLAIGAEKQLKKNKILSKNSIYKTLLVFVLRFLCAGPDCFHVISNNTGQLEDKRKCSRRNAKEKKQFCI